MTVRSGQKDNPQDKDHDQVPVYHTKAVRAFFRVFLMFCTKSWAWCWEWLSRPLFRSTARDTALRSTTALLLLSGSGSVPVAPPWEGCVWVCVWVWVWPGGEGGGGGTWYSLHRAASRASSVSREVMTVGSSVSEAWHTAANWRGDGEGWFFFLYIARCF